MVNRNKAKGSKGHDLTRDLLQSIGWSVYIAPHIDITYQSPTTYAFRKTGCNDIYAVPKLDEPTKKEGGFDIIANQKICKYIDIEPRELNIQGMKYFSISSFWQVKKTKSDPFNWKWKANRDLKDKTLRSCEQHNLPLEWCFIIHWPDGVGPSRGVPRIWRCDDKFFEPTAEELKQILEV